VSSIENNFSRLIHMLTCMLTFVNIPNRVFEIIDARVPFFYQGEMDVVNEFSYLT